MEPSNYCVECECDPCECETYVEIDEFDALFILDILVEVQRDVQNTYAETAAGRVALRTYNSELEEVIDYLRGELEAEGVA